MKYFAGSVVLFAILVGVLFYQNGRIKLLEAKFKQFQNVSDGTPLISRISGLDSRMQNLESEVGGLGVEDLSGELDDLKSNQEDQSSSIEDLSEKIQSAESEISDAQDTIDRFKRCVQLNEDDIGFCARSN